jgi:2-keto-4-pentenoate hydratase
MSSTSSQPDSSGLSVAARAAEVAKIAAELHAAWCERRTLPPLRVSYPWLTIDDAYAISLGFMARRTAAGERIVGKKIGVTSKAVQDMLGVHQPDFGFLTDAMQVDDGGTIVIGERMIQPRAEAEIALVLGSSLKGPGVTEADVLAATASVAACFEIVDSRIDRWDIRIVDTIADNASCGLFVLGAERREIESLRRSRSASARMARRCRGAWARRCRARRSRPWRGSPTPWAPMASRSMPGTSSCRVRWCRSSPRGPAMSSSSISIGSAGHRFASLEQPVRERLVHFRSHARATDLSA